MRYHPAVVATVAIILLTTAVSGPAISAVDLTASDSFSGAGLGDGGVTAGDVDLPETMTIERGEFGSGSYYLRVPPATVDLQAVEGRPIVSYQVSVEELGFTRSSVHVVSAGDTGQYELTLEEVAFGQDEIHNESYAGELTVIARYDDAEHVLASHNVTIEVTG